MGRIGREWRRRCVEQSSGGERRIPACVEAGRGGGIELVLPSGSGVEASGGGSELVVPGGGGVDVILPGGSGVDVVLPRGGSGGDVEAGNGSNELVVPGGGGGVDVVLPRGGGVDVASAYGAGNSVAYHLGACFANDIVIVIWLSGPGAGFKNTPMEGLLVPVFKKQMQFWGWDNPMIDGCKLENGLPSIMLTGFSTGCFDKFTSFFI
uniref:Uncharacterized protein n=1 Tax=Oryza glaberrima TaxID=4538 RepID=I1NND3_ORYGL